LLLAALLRARFRLLAAAVAGVVLVALLPAAPASAATEPGTVAVAFAWSGINGSSYGSTPAFTSRSVRARFAFQRWVWSRAASTAAVTGRLQRKVGAGAWKSTQQWVTSRTTVFDVRIRPYSLDPAAKGATVRYRVLVPTGGSIREGDVSPAVTVRYENVHRYTGFKLSMYKAVRRYCPAATIHVMRLPGGEAGEQPFGRYELRIAPSVRSYRAAYARSVALHECGHYLQWNNYGASSAGYRTMLRQANRIYGTNHNIPMEHMADCVARAVEPHGYLGYGGRCTARQLRYAKRILAGDRLF
jgi:hypothetical protein